MLALTRRITLLSLLATATGPAWADTAYKWRDANGTTHYSGTPPAAHETAAPPERLELASSARPTDDYYSVVNQARRMEQRRLRVERDRFERRLLQRQLAASEPAPETPAENHHRYPTHRSVFPHLFPFLRPTGARLPAAPAFQPRRTVHRVERIANGPLFQPAINQQ